ncbi:sigma-70 family RNA polymerase sigma factor [Methylobacterium sp. WL9]|nr:sigma-70 family RNA polymerase sigma factor [Methylobacterium sp. WL9]
MAELSESRYSLNEQALLAERVSQSGRTTPTLPAAAKERLGAQLRLLFSVHTSELLPSEFLDLIQQLETAVGGHEHRDADFRCDLLATLPALRRFSHSLAPNHADDLVQETLLKAWACRHQYKVGTNFKAWLFTILRNLFYSQTRRRKREVEDVDDVAAAQLVALPSQEHGMDLQKVWNLVAKLPATQREALLLVAAQGMTYEAAAEVLGCQVGTVKSRVSRARTALTETLETSGNVS